MTLVSDAVEATAKALEPEMVKLLGKVQSASGVASAKLIDKQLKAAYSPDQERDSAGRFGRGEISSTTGRPKERSKVDRAAASHKPSTAAKQRWAERNEKTVSSMVGGKTSIGNDAMDVTVRVGSTLHGLEVKTLVDNGNDKITVHPKSRVRKEKWASKNNAVIHTVAIDDRKRFGSGGFSGHRVYYRSGVGAYRLKGMTKVQNAGHLRELMKQSARHLLDWNEDDHPRDDHGQFSSGGGDNATGVKPTAKFKGWQPTGNENEVMALYDIKGGPAHNSTVTTHGLANHGIEVPLTPAPPAGMTLYRPEAQ